MLTSVGIESTRFKAMMHGENGDVSSYRGHAKHWAKKCANYGFVVTWKRLYGWLISTATSPSAPVLFSTFTICETYGVTPFNAATHSKAPIMRDTRFPKGNQGPRKMELHIEFGWPQYPTRAKGSQHGWSLVCANLPKLLEEKRFLFELEDKKTRSAFGYVFGSE